MLTEIKGLTVYKCKKLETFKNKIKYCVTTRTGGVSNFPYASLNISFKNVNDRKNSDINLDIVCDKVGFTRKNVVSIYEEHTDKIAIITEKNKEDFLFNKHHSLVYDAMITNVKNIPLLITVADCNAIVMYDIKNNVVANIHSGWKGTVQKIYLKTLSKMRKEFNTNPKDVICIYSPTIQECCWKTKDEKLVMGFKQYWPSILIDEYVTKDSDGWLHVDFPYVITKELIDIGIKKENIINEKICTCCNVDKFFSYRKKTELGEPDFGTQASIVELI